MAAEQIRATVPCFNEAAGIHRRKRGLLEAIPTPTVPSFNEAAGIHRRKQPFPSVCIGDVVIASMRPPEFTGGNPATMAAGVFVRSSLQ